MTDTAEERAAASNDELCACGAPAALAVGYRGEKAAALQCVRCAVSDPRTPVFHRDMAPLRWRPAPRGGADDPAAGGSPE